ncbi:hypothetical protein KSS87_011932 [Heliosperma pusillum]|nr:hypothetical protein KSS87_003822 [Heliosperma pusillum]KAH9612080.1 hypothetical protein KSS87_003065 [Heliosperma pusillum]KAH9612307.1 hypothetical protein KSS87_011932 [Heliosperma pusillum]
MVPYHFGCTLDCGLPNEDLPMVSEFMLKNELLFAPVMQLRKKVMDYCFLNDHRFDKTEIVCNFGIYHNTTKKDIESFLPNTMIEAIVVESWAIMLNKMQMEGSGSTRPRRIFYGIAHSIVVEKMIDIDHYDEDDGKMKKYRAEVFSTWDMWSGIYDEPLNLNAEMVFVPLLYEQHYFCVCIDFVREKLFYLDNKCYDDFNEMTFAYMTDVVANTYAEYLVSKGTENAEKKRDLYMGEVAATLILGDLNGNRTEVLERVTRHNEMKDMVEDGSASVVGSSRRGKSDGFGCTFNCGMADDKVILLSKFIRANQALFAKMLSRRKEVLDYCLLDDHNLSLDEVVAVFGDGRSLTRGDILSLRPTVPVNTAASHMSDYLEEKGVERAVELVGFPVVHIKFDWQTYEENNIKSGNFLMMHMIRYEGDIFEPDLKSKVYRRYYWAEMAAALLLADINEERENLIDRVKEFSATKDKIWKEVKLKRGKTGTVKEKKGVAEEEGEKVDSLTKRKEDTIEMTRINTEIPVLHNPPRKYHTIQVDIDDGQSKRFFKRYKRPAHSRGRGQGRGRGRGRNCSQ